MTVRSPTVSAIVPTLDRPQLLARAVRSVDEQTYHDVELVVVDGSEGETAAEVLRSSELSVEWTCVPDQPTGGVSAARNIGVEAASGQVVAFLDDDDEWRPGHLERLTRRLGRGDCDVVYGGIQYIGLDGGTTAYRTNSIEGDVRSAILRRNFIGTPSCVLATRDSLDAIGGFDESLPSWEDWDLYIRLAEQVRFGAVGIPFVRKHRHGEQMTDDLEVKRSVVADRLWEKHAEMARTSPGVDPRRFRAGIEFHLAESAYETERFGVARRHLIEAIKLDPMTPEYYLHLGVVIGGPLTFFPAQRLKRLVVRLTGPGRT